MTMPDGAQVSDDGQWWWDEGAQQWQAMAGGDTGSHEQAQPQFIFDTNGLFVDPDDADNPDNHVLLHHDAGTQVSFLVWNVGPGTGPASVTISVDDTEVQTWVSGDVAPNQSAAIDGDGFVHGCGRHSTGRHVFRARVTPGHSGGGDDTTNEVDVE